jgi:hypothetical protein
VTPCRWVKIIDVLEVRAVSFFSMQVGQEEWLFFLYYWVPVEGSWKFDLPVAMMSYCRISETSNDLLIPKFHVM